MSTFIIRGLGTAQPGGHIAQDDAAAEAEMLCCHAPPQRRMLRTIYRQSAVRRRGTVLLEEPCGHGTTATALYPAPEHADDRGPGVAQRMTMYARHALPLAQQATQRALHSADVSAHAITHLITVSCTGFGSPGLDVQLIDVLGLNRDVQRTMIGFMGCHGAINGLRTADGLARQPGAGFALICCVELCSLHFQYGWDAQRVVANALFADGAAAAVGAMDGGDHAHNHMNGNGRIHRSATNEGDAWRLHATGSYLVPESQDAMTWTIGDHGFVMTLSQRVPQLIEQHLEPWLTRWLDGFGLCIGDVASWAVHPGGPRVLDAVERGLKLPAGAVDVSREVLADCGNMSSPTVLFILNRLRARGVRGPCVALAFGPGLMVEAALLV